LLLISNMFWIGGGGSRRVRREGADLEGENKRGGWA
jgi:hypothetical protein